MENMKQKCRKLYVSGESEAEIQELYPKTTKELLSILPKLVASFTGAGIKA